MAEEGKASTTVEHRKAFIGKLLAAAAVCERENVFIHETRSKKFFFFLFYAFFSSEAGLFSSDSTAERFDWVLLSVFLGLLCFLFSFHMLFFRAQHFIYCDLIII